MTPSEDSNVAPTSRTHTTEQSVASATIGPNASTLGGGEVVGKQTHERPALDGPFGGQYRVTEAQRLLLHHRLHLDSLEAGEVGGEVPMDEGGGVRVDDDEHLRRPGPVHFLHHVLDGRPVHGREEGPRHRDRCGRTRIPLPAPGITATVTCRRGSAVPSMSPSLVASWGTWRISVPPDFTQSDYWE